MERFVKYGSDLKGMNLIFISFIRYKRVLGSLRFNKRFLAIYCRWKRPIDLKNYIKLNTTQTLRQADLYVF